MLSESLKRYIRECVNRALNEGWYDETATSERSKGRGFELGINPLRTDIGGHASREEVGQPSTFDDNGKNFRGEEIVLSDNRFTFYKVKNFGSPDISGTKALFGNEKEVRRAIDILNGAAKRNGKFLAYRKITSDSNQKKAQRTDFMSGGFWEFSYGGDWFILTPNPTEKMKPSKMKI